MSQTPSIGRIVIVPATALLPTDENNGGTEAPAVITRVWSDTMVNVRVLLDGHETPWKTSITLHGSRAEYEQAGGAFGCYWPERV